MRTYEYRTLDRMPTAAPHNGEITHPITETNLLARVLERAEKPLSEAQIAEFNRLGAQFEEDFARVRAGWGPSGSPTVSHARRLLDEVKLKGRFTDALGRRSPTSSGRSGSSRRSAASPSSTSTTRR